MLEWLYSNKEWVLSGIGAAIIGWIFQLFKKKNNSTQQTQITGSNCTNIQGNAKMNININGCDKDVE